MARLRTHKNRRKNKIERIAQDEANLRWIMRYGEAIPPELTERLLALIEGVEPLGEHEDIGDYLVGEFAILFGTDAPD